jgi:ABC-2 type transport system permease protein
MNDNQTPPGSPASKPSRRIAGALRATLHCEWRILRIDPAFWLVLALLAASVLYAVNAGSRHWQRQAQLVQAAQAEESRRLAVLKHNLKEVHAGRMTPASPFRDPRSSLWVGMTHGATTVALAPAPLAVAAVGLSDLHPSTIKV